MGEMRGDRYYEPDPDWTLRGFMMLGESEAEYYEVLLQKKQKQHKVQQVLLPTGAFPSWTAKGSCRLEQ